MLGLGLGLGLSKRRGGGGAQVSIFALSSGVLPTGFTVTRANANATQRGTNGAWSVVAANTARFHVLDGDNEAGLLVEPSRTNKCTNFNWNMTDFTNATVGGNASATVTIGTHPVHGHPVYRINNTTGGSGSAFITFGGTFANTNKHSFRTEFRVLSGATAGAGAFVNDSGGAMTSKDGGGVALNTDGTIYLEDFTPTNTGRTMRVYAAFNHDVIFWLNSLEEATFSTTPIVVAGAAATRAVDRVQATNLATAFGAAWNQAQGTLGIQVRAPRVWASDQIFSQFSDNSTNNVIGLRLYNGGGETGYVRPVIVSATTTQPAVSVAKVLPNRDFPMAVAWGSGAYKTIGGAGRTRRETGATLPSATLTRFDLTTRHNGGTPFYGVIKKLMVADRPLSNAQIGAQLMDSGARGIVTAGQSLVDNHRRSQIELDNTGEAAFNTVLDGIWTASAGNNWMVHGAVGGAAVLEKHAGAAGSYYDSDTQQFKVVYDVWKDSVDFFLGGGGTIEAIVWDGAQQDASAGAFATPTLTQEEFDGHVTVWNQMRSVIGSVPVIISPTTGRTDTEAVSYQGLRELQWRLADEVAYAYRGAESFDLPKADAIHLTSAGYVTKAQRESRKTLKVLGETISGGVDGASIVSAVRTGTSIVVTLAHDAGTDFTPSTAIRGFRFFDGASPIAITAAVRTNATTITLTLDSTPTGDEVLYYGYASLFAEAGDYANLVLDNGTPVMPLRAYKQEGLISPDLISGLEVWLDASDPATVLNDSLVPATNGQGVRRWLDKSGKDHHANQATVGLRPVYNATGQNGLGVLVADDSDDQMLITSTASLEAIDAEITDIIVFSGQPGATFRLVTQRRRASSPIAGTQWQNDSNTPNRLFLRVDADDTTPYTTATGARPTDAFDGNVHVAAARIGGGTLDEYYDGTKIVNGASYTDTHGVGSNQNWLVVSNINGKYCERLIYNRKLSDAETQALVDYMIAKWDI